jgi:hypothetical protein
VLAVLADFLAPQTAMAQGGGWEYQQYRIQARIAIDLPGGLAEKWAVELPAYLEERTLASLFPLCQLKAELATGAKRAELLQYIQPDFDKPPADLPKDLDKLILLNLRYTGDGYSITAREYDKHVARWSSVIHRECRQSLAVPEALFSATCQVFAPLLQFEADAKDPLRVTVTPRGASLPHGGDPLPWGKAGDVYLPIYRRTLRNGQVVENGIQVVPWTYVQTVEGKDKKLEYHVDSGNRQPFSTRRQGRVEQLLIALRPDADSSTLQLYSRRNNKKPLVGYEILAKKTGDEEPQHVGHSDITGEVQVKPGKSPVEMLLVKHGGQLLAKLPVMPGATPIVKVPLPDDDVRLAAEARLTAMREDLIDIVARRNILMARIRARIKKGDLAGAQELIHSLDELPSNALFRLSLDTAARALRSDDPTMQKRIDLLFQTTQTLSAQFLDLKPINELHNELREAQQGGAPAAPSAPAPAAEAKKT